jgi:HSP20 family molecular chaperone IbpA
MSQEDDTGRAGFTKIARGLSDLFNFLSELDEGKQPRRGTREKNGMIIEYSFGKRTLAEDETGHAAEAPPDKPETVRRRSAKPSGLEMLEPVTDMFDEPDEVVVLFEVPGVARKDIHCVLDGDILLLEAKTGERLYRKEILIEPRLAEEAPRLRLRNGVLEARLAKPA